MLPAEQGTRRQYNSGPMTNLAAQNIASGSMSSATGHEK